MSKRSQFAYGRWEDGKQVETRKDRTPKNRRNRLRKMKQREREERVAERERLRQEQEEQ